MNIQSIAAIIRRDLTFFFSDRRSLILILATPIAMASFFGYLFSGEGQKSSPSKVIIHIVDQDQSPVSTAIATGLAGEAMITRVEATAAQARYNVSKGQATAAIIIPKGFGNDSVRAMFMPFGKPEIALLLDPSQAVEAIMLKGLLAEHVMQAVSREAFSGKTGQQSVSDVLTMIDKGAPLPGEQGAALRDMLRGISRWQEVTKPQSSAQGQGDGAVAAGGLSIPYVVREEAMTAGTGIQYNSYAHSFAGMGVQFILFVAIDLGVGILMEREKGIWKRLRAAPVSRTTLLAGRTASGAITSFISLITCFAFGMAAFGIRIHGSMIGFLGMCIASALMAATCGLLIAAIGKTPVTTRIIAISVVLLLVMLGGAWIPSFLFPGWLQQATLAVPTSWAMLGFSGVTWRGANLVTTLLPISVLLGFSLLFIGVAIWRFRWEE